ncbi:DUF4282 domain-containing protein [Luteipulveratus mongoliensis]|uniref:Uncharacterized protein n=1 Tax=Luteipulveratus mongoliensis TaxID=571913 RepID=A0A0K1JNX3_9MICO|nr:DUF4282 domain-containing protein [Luteipulveratus mongoliensis]AKU18417.1 hypothetical protein VV02_25480 [Luteipulveratus mongoliensis]
MSSPTNGSWNDNPEQGPGAGPNPGPQYPGYNQGGGYGQPQPQGQPPQQSIGQGYQQPPQGGPQGPGPQGPGNFGQQAVGSAGQVVGGAGDGLGDLFSDFGFKKNLTEKIASIAFLLTVVWAFLRFVTAISHAFGKQPVDGGGQGGLKNMGTFEAFMTSLEALAGLVLTVAIARIILELAVNVARIAQRNKN